MPLPRQDQAAGRSRRGRPTSSQAADIDRRILEAGLALFLSEGYAVTSMEGVAARAGVSKGTLYARFDGKRDLFRAITADRLRTWSTQLLDPPGQGEGLRDRLYRRAIAILDVNNSPEAAAFERLAIAEARQFPELAHQFYQDGYLAVVEVTHADLLAAVPAGEVPPVDLRVVATVYAVSLLGVNRIEARGGEVGEAEQEAFAHQIVTLCLRGAGLS